MVSYIGLHIDFGYVEAFNYGTDNVSYLGILAESGATSNVYNFMRYGGSTKSGNVYVFNEMYLS